MPEHKDEAPESHPTALRWILPLLFIVLVVTLGYLLYPMLKPSQGSDIVMNVINLRSESDTLLRSELVTQTDDMVRGTDDRALIGQWTVLTQCMPTGCDDSEFFNFIALVCQQQDVPNSDLIQNMIATYKYWGTEEIVRFSKAMTTVTRSIEDTYSRSLEEKWKTIVSCDGTCPEENDLFFQAIEIAVEL